MNWFIYFALLPGQPKLLIYRFAIAEYDMDESVYQIIEDAGHKYEKD